MTCITIDDEPGALDILALFIAKTPFLDHIGAFRDPFQAMDFILNSKPDLIFLDINMPGLTGIQLLKSLSHAPLVILTTAYSEHAIDSYDLNVVDYLLKPIEFDRFLKAVMKAKELFFLKSENERRDIKTSRQDEAVVYIKSGTKTFRIKIDSILYVEGLGNYVNFILSDKKVIAYLSMQDVLNLLPPGLFCRIHKSYVISLKYIDVIEKHQVIIKNKSIPIGLTYRDRFSKIIEKK
jgi:two-component system, LytTR family, response regulator